MFLLMLIYAVFLSNLLIVIDFQVNNFQNLSGLVCEIIFFWFPRAGAPTHSGRASV
jgi:hypothetical protein